MIVRVATFAMGTRFECALEGNDESHLLAVGEEAIRVIEELHARLSLFERGSLVSRINRLAAQQAVLVDQDTFDMFEECLLVHEESDGAFDITVAPLMAKLGFYDRSNEFRRDSPIGSKLVELDRETTSIRFLAEGVQIDLGGVAKGHALDLAAEVIEEAGVHRAFLHAGTSTCLAICRTDDDPFQIGIADDPHGLQVKLRSGALSVSAPHGREIEHDEEKLGHVLDGRDGTSVRHTKIAAVTAPSARLADAWSTALIVRGSRPDTMPDDLHTAILGVGSDDRWNIDPTDSDTLRLTKDAAFKEELT